MSAGWTTGSTPPRSVRFEWQVSHQGVRDVAARSRVRVSKVALRHVQCLYGIRGEQLVILPRDIIRCGQQHVKACVAHAAHRIWSTQVSSVVYLYFDHWNSRPIAKPPRS
jgi:hypothetical protein